MSREFIYIRLTGPTASYRVPTAISGTQIALEAPAYSSILGMLSYATGFELKPKDTRIGFRYTYNGKGMDLETIHRWERRYSGSYTYNETNIRSREIHYNIELEVILDNSELIGDLEFPSRQMTFGRSQDLATIEEIQLIKANKTDHGKLWGTLLPISMDKELPGEGMIYNLPEYFDYTEGKIRRAKNTRSFIALTQYIDDIYVENLWKLEKEELDYPIFYLHEWSN